MKRAVIALAILGASEAFVAPAANQNAGTAMHVINGPQSGGTEGSTSVPSQYGRVSVDNPWGESSPNSRFYGGAESGSYMVPEPSAGGGNKLVPKTPSFLPLGKGEILSKTGGIEGANKYTEKGDTTKWATTPWAGTGKGTDTAFSPPPIRAKNNSLLKEMGAAMPLAKGEIKTKTGGNEGASKYIEKGDTTKWATTPWAGTGKGTDSALTHP